MTDTIQRKKFSVGALLAMLGLLATIAILFVVRDIGMIYVYGSIFTGIAEANMESLAPSIGLMSYVFMALLYILPIVLPFIYRITGIAYDDEIASPLFPAVNKVLGAFMYLFIGVSMIIPLILSFVGLFTYAYLFVAFNVLLIVMSNVVIFYYLGTYMLQRVGAPIGVKYTVPTVLMVATNGFSILMTFVFTKIMGMLGKTPALLTQLEEFKLAEDKLGVFDQSTLTLWLIIMLIVICGGVLLAGLFYNMTQNILYASVPSFFLIFSEVLAFERIKDATRFLVTTPAKVEKLNADILAEREKLLTASSEKVIESINKKILSLENQLSELEENILYERVAVVIAYIIVFAILFLMFLGFVRAIVGLIKNVIESTRSNEKYKAPKKEKAPKKVKEAKAVKKKAAVPTETVEVPLKTLAKAPAKAPVKSTAAPTKAPAKTAAPAKSPVKKTVNVKENKNA